MEYIEVGRISDITEGSMKAYTVQGREILVSSYNGKYYAIDGKCTHRGGDLSKGKLEGKIVTCPLHGSKFDVTTGGNLSGPKIGIIKIKTKDEPSYEVKVEGDIIKVNI